MQLNLVLEVLVGVALRECIEGGVLEEGGNCVLREEGRREVC